MSTSPLVESIYTTSVYRSGPSFPLTCKYEKLFLTLPPGEPHKFEMKVGPSKKRNHKFLSAGQNRSGTNVGDDLEKGEQYRGELANRPRVFLLVRDKRRGAWEGDQIDVIMGLSGTVHT